MMIDQTLGRTSTIVGLCAALAFGPVACDQGAEGRSDALGGQPDGSDPCDGLAEAAAACAADSSCAVEDLEAQFAMCTASGKADGPLEAIEEKIDELKQSLVDRAAQCYADEDTGCLWWTYWALAAGAKVLGLGTASSNMFNFLNCGDDPLELSADAVRADSAVVMTEAAFLDQVWCEGQALAEANPDLSTTIDIPGMVIAGADNDIWYGLGNFTISATAQVEIVGGRVEWVEITTTVFDIYDWHEGLTAGGNDQAVAGFQDAWAAYLVDEGEACEFEMGTEWTETIEDYQTMGCDPQPADDEPRE